MFHATGSFLGAPLEAVDMTGKCRLAPVPDVPLVACTSGYFYLPAGEEHMLAGHAQCYLPCHSGCLFWKNALMASFESSLPIQKACSAASLEIVSAKL